MNGQADVGDSDLDRTATVTQASNGPLPIWSRTVTTGGLVSDRRCQFAPSTTSVCPEMNRAYGDARNVAAQPSSRSRPDPQRRLAHVLVVGALEVGLDVGGHVLVREQARARAR